MLTRAATYRVVLRSALLTTMLIGAAAPSLQAQSLRQRISDLFIFGAGQEPLFLAGSGDPTNPAALALREVAERLVGRGRGLAGLQLGLTPTSKF